MGALLGGKPAVPATDSKVVSLKAESQKVATEMETLEKELAAAEAQLEDLLLRIPNPPD